MESVLVITEMPVGAVRSAAGAAPEAFSTVPVPAVVYEGVASDEETSAAVSVAAPSTPDDSPIFAESASEDDAMLGWA